MAPRAVFLTFISAFIVAALCAGAAAAPAATPAPAPAPDMSPAPAPAPPYCNITAILTNAGQFSTFLSELGSAGLVEGIQGQINQSYVIQSGGQRGLTFFAPTNGAFSSPPAPALLKGLNESSLKRLLAYHVLTSYYPLSALQHSPDGNRTATYATYNSFGGGGSGGGFELTITDLQGTVSLSTGYNTVNLTNTLYDTFPCGVFGIDSLLYPTDLFGLPAPSPSPSLSSSLSPNSSPLSPTGSTSTAHSPSDHSSDSTVNLPFTGIILISSFLLSSSLTKLLPF